MGNEKAFYDEIKAEIEAQVKSSFLSLNKRELYVHWGIGSLKTNLQRIIIENPIQCKCIIEFAERVPQLFLDIFALITDGNNYGLLILEVKDLKAVALREWSQLVGYCLVSGARYGLLVNVDNDGSKNFIQMLNNERHLSHIQTIVNFEKREHLLGFMKWNSITKSFEYSTRGAIKTLSGLSELISSDFR